jgi:ATP-dependent DNA ligase
VSRHGREHTRRFPDVAWAITKLSAHTLVLDGEAAIYDEQLRTRFGWAGERARLPMRKIPLSIHG